jgi:O-antigen ligase
MLAFVAWSTASLMWSKNLSQGMALLQTYVLRFVLFLFLIPNQIRTRGDLDGLMNTLALNGWILMAAGVGTVLLEGYQPGARLQAAEMNENEMGTVALIAMTGVLWQAMQSSKRFRALRTLQASVFTLLAISLVAMSGSRGSALSLAVTLVAFCFWRTTRRWGILGLLVLALGAASVPLIFTTTLERFAGTPGDTLLGGREALWQAAAMLILSHPWRGVGIGNARYAVMPYLRPLRNMWGHGSRSIHNPVLTIWAETGLLGLTLYLGVLASAVWSFVQQVLRYRRSGARFLMPYFALVSSTFAGYMVSWIKGGGMERSFTYFLMLALLLIPSSLDSRALEEDAETNIQLVGQSRTRAEALDLF